MEAINEILNKANYCLGCKAKPCSTNGCPLNNNIPQFIDYIKQENYYEAYKTLCNTTVLPRNMWQNMSTYEAMSRFLY